MKNLIPETKRSYFKLTFHVMIFSILVSLLLITMNNHSESEEQFRLRQGDKIELLQQKIIIQDSIICKMQKELQNVSK